MAAAHHLEPKCGHPMAASTSNKPLSFDLLAGLTLNFCIEKIIASAIQSASPTPDREGFLVVGFGGQKLSLIHI